ncbi:HET-domain-containing protein [Neurospora crassa]|nr:HET-domain-containing protein [Neurospora crassa]
MPLTYTTPSGDLHLSEEAFNRFCERCDSMFESIALEHQRDNIARNDERWKLLVLPDDVPFGTLKKLFNASLKGDCHFCCSLTAQILFTHLYNPSCRKGWSITTKHYHHSEEYLRLKFRLMEDVPRVHAIPTSLNTGSEASLDQALRWVENCVFNHPSCNKVVLENPQGKYPARFLDVGCTGSRTVRLFETRGTGMDFQKHRHMTLSHCWGDSVPARLLLDNYASRLKGFALDELPRTFQDAVRLTQRLNVQFLWIDSLCIIQDSPDDWATESAKMRFVYQNTYLNLAAAVSPNSSAGFFFPRYPLSFVPCAIKLAPHITIAQNYKIRETPILHTRGWELYWECSMVRASEHSPNEVPGQVSESGLFNSPPMKLFQRERLLDDERLEAWASLVEVYSGRKLTKQSDKLVAISGLAEHLSNGWDGVTYLAGLWSYRLRESLLWRCSNVEQSKGRNNDIAPSWSWASLSAKCRLHLPLAFERVDSLAEVLEAMVSPATPTHLFGQVRRGGMVRIRGPLLRARSTPWPSWWSRDLGKERDGISISVTPTGLNIILMWDEQNSHDSAIIYLAPLQVRHEASESHLDGLLLRPALTAPVRKGQFERLGAFRMSQKDYLRKHLAKSENPMKLYPHLNRPLDAKLKQRYLPEPGSEQYSDLAKFLDYLEIGAQYNRESDSPDENLGQDEGNGIYRGIYELV